MGPASFSGGFFPYSSRSSNAASAAALDCADYAAIEQAFASRKQMGCNCRRGAAVHLRQSQNEMHLLMSLRRRLEDFVGDFYSKALQAKHQFLLSLHS
jgi:hypothetical protein